MSFVLSLPLPFLKNNKRQVGSIDINVILTENTSDVLTITKQPIQQGAPITDHAYKEPTTLSMAVLFEDNILKSLSAVYQDLQDLQNSRVPFDVVTPKRKYKNMLIATLGLSTDSRTENALAISLTLQEAIIVKVTTVTVARSRQKSPGTTGKTEPAGQKQSALYTGAQAIRGL